MVTFEQPFALYFGFLLFIKLVSIMKEVKFKIIQADVPFLYPLTLQAPAPQNGQTHSNNSSAVCRRIR